MYKPLFELSPSSVLPSSLLPSRPPTSLSSSEEKTAQIECYDWSSLPQVPWWSQSTKGRWRREVKDRVTQPEWNVEAAEDIRARWYPSHWPTLVTPDLVYMHMHTHIIMYMYICNWTFTCQTYTYWIHYISHSSGSLLLQCKLHNLNTYYTSYTTYMDPNATVDLVI